jgi:oligoribonuclease NrnB/cAMP/cGMP phosphodiesterase (DHH superfamily)
MSAPPLCIYHGNCADGFTAAWAVWKRFPDAEFVPGIYGQESPDTTGRRVILVDFSYPEPVLRRMAEQARSLLVLDHHKTAAEALAWMPRAVTHFDRPRDPWTHHITEDAYLLECQGHPTCAAWFNMEKSGARLAWEFFHPGTPVPHLVRHVEDRDLWRFALPGIREIQAVIFSYA